MMYGRYGPMMSYGFGGGFGILGLIITVAFWALIIGGVAMLVRYLADHEGWKNHPTHTSKTALQILQERYARGEINKQEYEEKKADLSKP